ncbi:uncharacterized protein EV154DRAFT_492242 [Mucor mucedo]|uniref:uncharacterized protein n=1 Tax=Mucor mucedo TaxID=29922 RepID=UPI00221F43D9|nr:uncharacterized protein EV154DRAFT_492242 [Mucor mucedo]KAI7896439.1 hypothetical protein EV154DRAFT_492242 [Mucor mucedo]
MTRTKDNVNRHEKHVARNGQTEIRFGVKKMGAGAANWGVLGEEVLDVQEIARTEMDATVTDTKIKLVDSETFENMRHEQES